MADSILDYIVMAVFAVVAITAWVCLSCTILFL